MIIPAALYLRFNHTSGSSLSLWDRVQRSVSLYRHDLYVLSLVQCYVNC